MKCLTGSSHKTENPSSGNYMNGTTQVEPIGMEESQKNSSVPESTSVSPYRTEQPCSSGGSSETNPDKKESITRFSGVRKRVKRPPSLPLTLSERLTPLLISAGLVKGTTLTFGRRLLSRGIRVSVLFAPDGRIADARQAGFMF